MYCTIPYFSLLYHLKKENHLTLISPSRVICGTWLCGWHQEDNWWLCHHLHHHQQIICCPRHQRTNNISSKHQNIITKHQYASEMNNISLKHQYSSLSLKASIYPHRCMSLNHTSYMSSLLHIMSSSDQRCLPVRVVPWFQ